MDVTFLVDKTLPKDDIEFRHIAAFRWVSRSNGQPVYKEVFEDDDDDRATKNLFYAHFDESISKNDESSKDEVQAETDDFNVLQPRRARRSVILPNSDGGIALLFRCRRYR